MTLTDTAMRILIVHLYFFPEVGAMRTMYELAVELQRRRHKVDVSTTLPREYYIPKDIPKEFYSRYRRKRFLIEKIKGVRIVRFGRVPTTFKNVVLRGIEYFLAPIFIMIGGLFSRKADIIHVYSPPITLGIVGKILSIIKRSKLVLRTRKF